MMACTSPLGTVELTPLRISRVLVGDLHVQVLYLKHCSRHLHDRVLQQLAGLQLSLGATATRRQLASPSVASRSSCTRPACRLDLERYSTPSRIARPRATRARTRQRIAPLASQLVEPHARAFAVDRGHSADHALRRLHSASSISRPSRALMHHSTETGCTDSCYSLPPPSATAIGLPRRASLATNSQRQAAPSRRQSMVPASSWPSTGDATSRMPDRCPAFQSAGWCRSRSLRLNQCAHAYRPTLPARCRSASASRP